MSAGTRPTMIRLCEIQKYLVENGQTSLSALAAHFEMSERTIMRDIAQLNQPPIEAQVKFDKNLGGYRCQNPASLTTLPLTDDELHALLLMRSLSETLGETPVGLSVRSALRKIQAVLPESMQRLIDHSYQGVACFIEPLPTEPIETRSYLRPLLLAIEYRQCANFTYTSPSAKQPTQREVDPYLLFFRYGRWYLRAHCHLRQHERDFALGRMADLRIDPRHYAFTAPPPGEIEAQIARRFSSVEGKSYLVKIRFDADTARRVAERTWHDTQQIDMQSDGSCILSMTVEGLSSVTGWIMSYCGHAIPLEPKELVSEVKRAARMLFTGN